MSIGYKGRKWMANLFVSASGPETSPIFEQAGYYTRTRMAADFRYTTADIDFLEPHFKERNYDSGDEEFSQRLVNPTRGGFFLAPQRIGAWLEGFRDHPDWDGGGLLLCFAGHGREGDGAFVLSDGVVTPDDLIEVLTWIAGRVPSPGRLRLSGVFDSCHSGAFLTTLLDAALDEYKDMLVPFNLAASCMEDEYADEDSGLGHGLFTYCFSVQEPAPGSLSAVAIQPDNTFGPSLAIAGNHLGCSLLSAGSQNPILHWNGTSVIEVGNQAVELFDVNLENYIGLSEMRTKLKAKRDRVVQMIRPVPQSRIFTGPSTDSEMRRRIRETVKLIKDAEKS